MTSVSREKAAAIVGDLARGSRSVAMIAKRHHVPEQTVTALRRTYGPELHDLGVAAEKLRRPAVVQARLEREPQLPTGMPSDLEVAAAPASTSKGRRTKVSQAGKLGRDGLTSVERGELRVWAESIGRKCGTRPSADLVSAWEEAGRPVVEAPAAEAAPAVDTVGEPDAEAPDDVRSEAECFDGDCTVTERHTHGRSCAPACDCHGVDDPTPDTMLDHDVEMPIEHATELVAVVEEVLAPIPSAWPGHLEAVTIRQAILAGEVLDVIAYAAEHLHGPLATWVTGWEHLRDQVAEHRHEAQEIAQLTEQVTVWAVEHELVVTDDALRALAQRLLWVS